MSPNLRGALWLMLGASVALGAAGCSGDQVKRATYNALHDKNCIDKVGYADCDPKRPSYDRYRRDRARALDRQGD